MTLASSFDCIVAYGIGPIFESHISQYQYCVLQHLKELFGCPTFAYDPIWTEDEKERVGLDDIRVSSFPYSDCHELHQRPLFYMPHCDAVVYQELLLDLKQCDIVDEFAIYGNDLCSYSSLQPISQLFRLEKRTILNEFQIRADVFNDCCLQYFMKI